MNGPAMRCSAPRCVAVDGNATSESAQASAIRPTIPPPRNAPFFLPAPGGAAPAGTAGDSEGFSAVAVEWGRGGGGGWGGPRAYRPAGGDAGRGEARGRGGEGRAGTGRDRGRGREDGLGLGHGLELGCER